MPPFMRNSNARALSLARWQYDLLLRWVADVTAPGADILAEGDVAPLSQAAEERRARDPRRSRRRRGRIMTAVPVEWRTFESRVGTHVLVLRGSQILDVGADEVSDSLLSDYLKPAAG